MQLSRDAAAQKLFAAALAVPGVLCTPHAQAESAPENATVSVKYMHYRDSQPSRSRMRVDAPSLVVIAPIGSRWTIEAGLVGDSISGASPPYHSSWAAPGSTTDTTSGATPANSNTVSETAGTGIRDYRRAADFKLTRHFSRGALGLTGVVSTESDYFSRALAIGARIHSEDNNTTLAFGAGASADRINSVNGTARGELKRSREFMLGITQALSTTSIVQSNVTITRGKGYYTDPYKPFDARPDFRNMVAWLTRYNHFIPALGGALNASYRFYHDSFGIDSHTLELVWRQPLAQSWSLSPMIRHVSQSAADFYFDPPWPQGSALGKPYSADQRLSAFGSFSVGLRIDKSFAGGWAVNAKAEITEQRGSWRLGGGGSPGLEPFRSQTFIVGLAKTF